MQRQVTAQSCYGADRTHATPYIDITTHTEGVCLGALDMDFKTRRVHQGVTCRSSTVIWVLGSNTDLTVSSPARKKTKIPKQHTAHNIKWSLVDRSRQC